MPIPGYNGINDAGVLLSSSNLTALSLSSDKSTVSVGRVGHVGVPGLLLGGGISFYSSQYGFASDNVKNYQVRSITS
jgi:hypothetical protein